MKTLLIKTIVVIFIFIGTGSTFGHPLLQKAAWKGNIDEVKRLLAAGSDVNASDDDGTTALAMAATGGHAEVVKLLIKAGADVNAGKNLGTTALALATTGGRTEVIKLLKSAGALSRSPAERPGHDDQADANR